MIQCACIVQQDGVAPEARLRLEAELSAIAQRRFSEDLEVAWFEVHAGSGFTGGQPSRSSIVAMTAPAMAQDVRTEILTEICDLWTRAIGCHVNDVVATVMDRPN